MNSTESLKERLIQIVLKKTYFEGEFTLSSGKKSSYYLDAKKTAWDQEGGRLLGNLIYNIIKSQSITADSIGGMTMGADIIAYSTSQIAFDENYELKVFSVRKEAKKHGTKQFIEGNFESGDRVIVVEDVATTGASSLKAIERIRDAGAQVLCLIPFIDRLEGASKAAQENDIPFYPVLNIKEITEYNS